MSAVKKKKTEEQFPLCILYTSPPAAEELRKWLLRVESKRRGLRKKEKSDG